MKLQGKIDSIAFYAGMNFFLIPTIIFNYYNEKDDIDEKIADDEEKWHSRYIGFAIIFIKWQFAIWLDYSKKIK